jgi:inosine-uridine nucleoside N-ribohydrolase
MSKVLPGLLMVLLLVGSVAAQGAEPQAVIVDTDMTSDDWMAITFLLHRPEFQVQAITVTGSGFADCDAGVQVALGLLALADYGDVPVSCWKDEPWHGGGIRVPAGWRTTLASVADLDLPDGGVPADKDAVELFSDTVAAAAGPMTVLALGPLTNLAAAFEADPALAGNIDMIYVMGGAVDVPGSGVSDANTTAEWNIYADPPAARAVFESGAPITLVPLDATNDVPVTADYIARFTDAAQTPAATFVAGRLSEGAYFWDQLAAAVMAENGLVTLTPRDVTVIDDGGAEDGRTKPVGNGSEIIVATAPDVEAFQQLFIETLNQ